MKLSLPDILKKTYITIIGLNVKRRWESDFKKESRNPSTFIPLLLEKSTKKQLYIVPHADDDILSGYALTRLQNENLLLGYCGLTGSNPDRENQERRREEFYNYARRMNVNTMEINERNSLSDIIRNQGIQVIYLPSIVDWHAEHRRMNYDLYDALSKVDTEQIQIMWYSVTVPIETKKYIVPMTETEQEEKYSLFWDVYVSQRHMPLRRFRLQERLNVLGCDSYAGECFYKIELNIWKKITALLRAEEPDGGLVKEFNLLKRSINSISAIRKYARKYYLELGDIYGT